MNSGRCWILAIATILWATAPAIAEPLRGYHSQVKVEADTRLDWTFALANQSLEKPPADWLPDYQSAAQSYELFVPPNLNRRKPAPLVLLISPSAKPAGWSQWQAVCMRSGVIFASPFAAGNDCPFRRRVRIVLDVLDDVRRRQPIDADRTYLAGFSGGARIACSVAFALPEYFGGVIAICGAEKLREESWLRERVAERLSVALITGEQDFNRAELERLRGPLLADVGVRAKVWTVAGLGHAIPDERQLAAALDWLEEAVPARRRKAQQWPAMHIAANAAPTRAEAAELLLAEARHRLEKNATLFSGLMQLQGLSVRWPDVPAAAVAHKILLDYDAKTDRPWELDDLAEQRRFLVAEARATGAYATGPLPPQYSQERPIMARAALEMWKQILSDDPDGPHSKEATQQIHDLEQPAAEAKP